MAGVAQKRAVTRYRKRLSKLGMVRFEVIGLASDKALLRDVARRLAAGDPDVAWLRQSAETSITPESRGGIWRALRASPLVGAGLDFSRPVVPESDVEL
jgi:hypothetical protein